MNTPIEKRHMTIFGNSKTSCYTNNTGGQRIMKSYGTMEGVYINGAPQGITFHETDNFTLYPASILSVNKNRFTKHYFIGDKRIASKIGTGLFYNVYGRNGSYVTAGQQDYAERMNQIQTQKEAYYKKVGVAPGVPTEKGAYGDPENTGVGYNAILTELGNHDVPQGWIQTPRPNTTPGTNPGPPVSWNDPTNPDDPQAGYGYIPNDTTKEETFFYHSDHLGSTSYITDDKANITQYDAYLPYGELLVDEHSSSEDLPYKFNGKQFDEETGLYYYGARYMNPITSLWYGVDPLAEKYPTVGGFVFCISNPVRLVDPDGKKIWIGNGSNSSTTLDLIRGTLPEKERSFVQLDVNGYIDQKILLSGLNKNSSNNLKDLITVVQDRRVIKYFGLATSVNMLYDENDNGNFKVQNIAFNPPTHGSEIGSNIKNALANDKTLNVKKLRDVYKRQGLDESYSVTGNLGFTLRPNNEQGNYPNNSERALSSFIEVYTSAVGTTKLDQYINAGHELYNHVLFYLMGRDPTHNNKDLNRHEERTLNDIYKYNPILLRNDKNKFE